MFCSGAAMIARAPGSVKQKSSSLPSRAPRAGKGMRGASSPLGDRAVWAGDQLEQMPVRVVEIDAAAAIEVVDLAGPLASEIRVMLDAGGADTGECGVEFGVANQKGVVLRAKALGVGKIEGDSVARLDRDEVAPFRCRLEVQDVV